MRPGAAWVVIAGAGAWTALALVAPWPVAVVQVGASLAFAPRRRGLVTAMATLAVVHALMFGLLLRADPVWSVGPLVLSGGGALSGLVPAARLAAMLGGAALVDGSVGLPRLLDGLQLPPRVAATMGAVALLAQDVAHDARRLVLARRLDGSWPDGRLRQARAAGALVAPSLRLAVARAETRRSAIRLAGLDLPAAWAPTVAVAAICVAGRLATIAVPNVAFTYVVAFAGGLLFGPRVAALAAGGAMLATDLALSGLYPGGLTNVPAMAMVGAAGGWLRGVAWSSPAGRTLAACVGVVCTLAFSVLADVATWAVVPEYRAVPGSLALRVAAGLAFNVVPAVVNAILFAAAVPAVGRSRPDEAAMAP